MRSNPLPYLLLFLAVLGLVLREGRAQSVPEETPQFSQLTTEGGGVQTQINHILQDSKGFMWFGTWMGLYKYDGLNLKQYKPRKNDPHSLQGSKVQTIFEDSKGIIWVGTIHEGLQRFEREKEQFVQYKYDPADPSSLSNNDVSAILEDRQGVLWIGTSQGINRLEDRPDPVNGQARVSFRKYPETDRGHQPSPNRANVIYEDAAGRLWVGTSTGLYLFQPAAQPQTQLFTKVPLSGEGTNNLNRDYVYSILQVPSPLDRPGSTTLCLGTRAGLLQLTLGTPSGTSLVPSGIVSYTHRAGDRVGLSNNRVRELFQTRNDLTTLWVGTEEGLNRMDLKTGTFSQYRSDSENPHSLSNNLIYSFWEDRTGVLWIGTGKGVNKLDLHQKPFRMYQAAARQAQGLTNSFVTALAPGLAGTVWAGTNGGGLNRILLDSAQGYPRQILPIRVAQPEAHQEYDFIYSICTDRAGQVWVGTNGGGIYRFREADLREGERELRNITRFRQQDGARGGLNDNYVLALYEDSRQQMWVGTWNGGVNRYDPRTGTFTQVKDLPGAPVALSAFPVTAFQEDQEGAIWVGTRGSGVFTLSPAGKGQYAFRQLAIGGPETSFTSSLFVNFIFQDRRRRVWVGTEGGLHLFDRAAGSFTTYNEKDGLPVEVMQGMLEDGRGQLWVSTTKGLTRFDPAALGLEKPGLGAFHNYDREDGLQEDIFNNNACARTPQGLLLFGGINGINAFLPDQILANPHPPQVQLTDFLIFNQPVPIGPDEQGRTILSKAIGETRQIDLLHHDNSLTFAFAALHFASPGRNRVAFRLEGFDREWVYPSGSRNLAHYTNLDPGTYTFRVRASNNDGVWSPQEASVHLVIHPPLWKTGWAYTFYCLVAVGLLYLLRAWELMRANYRHTLTLERVKREKDEAVHQLKLRFFTNISHEIRTPLTLILGSLDRVQQAEGLGLRVNRQLLVMQKNGNLLLRLINQLLDFRKMESGHLGLRAAKGDLVAFTEEICRTFAELVRERQIDFRFEAWPEIPEVWYDGEKLEKIILNLLSNAFKFTPDRGRISVTVSVDAPECPRQEQERLAGPKPAREYVRIRVQDNGVGLAADQQEKVFDLYHQAESSDHYYENKGTGLGLTLTKTLVEMHHGVVTLESEEGKGACFSVFLPLGESHLTAPEKTESLPLQATRERNPAPASALRPHPLPHPLPVPQTAGQELPAPGENAPLLLVVEDNLDVRAFIRETFAAEYQVLEAANGAEGLALALDRIPDLILSDVMMPEMDGLAFCQKIKTEERTCHIPLILLTARTSLPFQTEGLETGADDYITKPFQTQLLVLKVRNLVRLKQNLIRQLSEKKFLAPRDIASNPLDEAFLTRTIAIIHTHLHDPDFCVDDFGKELGMSRMQLYRKLKALTGLAANEFIRNQRLQRAAQLLTIGHLSVAEVTYEVGFTDLKYFRKCFKEYFEVNPSAYGSQKEATGSPLA